MGARVPMYVISPWSRGGWVNSQVFDHTSIGMFLEKRFGVHVSSISPWHRAVSGDLTSAFDFNTPNDNEIPALPDLSNYAANMTAQAQLPPPAAPAEPQPLFQERGVRGSRALPYVLSASAYIDAAAVTLTFLCNGTQGAVFHVYDQLHLNRIPRRYTVEPGKSLRGGWSSSADGGAYNLWVYGPNGFVRSFAGNAISWSASSFQPELRVEYNAAGGQLVLLVRNGGARAGSVTVAPNNPFLDAPVQTLTVPAAGMAQLLLGLSRSANWYDFTVSAANFERRLAGRMETGANGISDPAMAMQLL
jgi:phospholipase C